ncbi:hypothetical protein AB4Z35_30660, partial [Pseudomonas sp. KB_15]|uniref:hypothetical protein n=1 Tax=Pseudomonas sp. KB_15 TaxID=3233035 RepID=UPI003F94452B
MGMAMSTRHAVAWAAAWTAATAAWAQALPPGPIVPEDPAQRLLREQRQRDLEREATQPPARIDSGVVVAPDARVEDVAETSATFDIARIDVVGNTVLA